MKAADFYGRTHVNATRAPTLYEGTEVFGSTVFGYGHFNECDHYCNRSVNLPYTGVLRRNGSTTCNGYRFFRNLSNATLVQQGKVTHPIVDLSEAQRTAWHTMQEEFAGNVSLINFIFELKDFRDIAKFMAKQPMKKLGNIFRRYQRTFTHPRVKNAWKWTRPIAEAHLVNEFAIKPTVSDVLTIAQQLGEIVREAQDQFQLQGQEANSRHYSEVLSENRSKLVKVNRKYLSSGHFDQTVFGATLEYKYNYVKRDTLDAMSHYWGMRLTGEALWNMIPFSFLADYFVGIGKAISLMEHDSNVTTQIMQYAESLCTRSQDGWFVEPNLHPSTVLVDQRVASDVTLVTGSESTLYTRRVTHPNQGAVLPRIRRPSNKQATNATALLRCFL
jgi:hypothetical protein